MIEKNKHNYITATYYLMLGKFLRNEGKSIADLRNLKKLDSSRSSNLKKQTS